MEVKDALIKSYSVLSPFSDKQKWEFNNNLIHLKFLIKHLKKTDKILDYGCGIGILSLALKFLGYDVKGEEKFVFLPHNEYFVKDDNLLKQIWEDNRLIVESGDFSPNQFDVIISVAVVEHQQFPRLFLENLLQKVKSGGLVYLATPNMTNLLNRFRFLFGRAPLSNIQDFFYQAEKFVGHWREYTLKETKQMCIWAGMQVVEAHNLQNQRPVFTFNKWRTWYRNLFKILAYLIPGCGDANIIICRK